MYRGKAWRRRGGQAFELGEPGVADRTTANSLVASCRGPRQDDQTVKTKPLARSCLRILDQGLGPTRAHSSRNRPLEQPGTVARLAQGWAGHPGHSRPMRLTSRGTPAPDVDALRLVTRFASRNDVFDPRRLSFGDGAPPAVHQPVKQGLGHGAVPVRVVRRSPKASSS